MHKAAFARKNAAGNVLPHHSPAAAGWFCRRQEQRSRLFSATDRPQWAVRLARKKETSNCLLSAADFLARSRGRSPAHIRVACTRQPGQHVAGANRKDKDERRCVHGYLCLSQAGSADACSRSVSGGFSLKKRPPADRLISAALGHRRSAEPYKNFSFAVCRRCCRGRCSRNRKRLCQYATNSQSVFPGRSRRGSAPG